jgi:hypothetical protein
MKGDPVCRNGNIYLYRRIKAMIIVFITSMAKKFANKIDKDGWELVSTPDTSSGLNWAISGLIFKRQRNIALPIRWAIRR